MRKSSPRLRGVLPPGLYTRSCACLVVFTTRCLESHGGLQRDPRMFEMQGRSNVHGSMASISAGLPIPAVLGSDVRWSMVMNPCCNQEICIQTVDAIPLTRLSGQVQPLPHLRIAQPFSRDTGRRSPSHQVAATFHQNQSGHRPKSCLRSSESSDSKLRKAHTHTHVRRLKSSKKKDR